MKSLLVALVFAGQVIPAGTTLVCDDGSKTVWRKS